MSASRTGIGKDPVVRTLGNVLVSAPVATALALGSLGLTREHPRPSPVPAPAVHVAEPRPILTRVVVQPAFVPATRPASIEGDDMVRLAFAPEAATRRPQAVRDIPTGSVRAAARQVSRDARGWRMEVLRDVTVGDGLRLESGSRRIALEGVEPLASQCRRVDGLEESCAARAATRLELLVRGRTVTCRVYDAPQGEPATALCRADKIDLAEDLVRNGLARRVEL